MTDQSHDPESVKRRHREAAARVVPVTEGQFIDGSWQPSESARTLDVSDPTTGERLCSIDAGTSEDIDSAVDAAATAFCERWRDTSPAERSEMLTEVADRVEADAEAFATLETLDNGKPIHESCADIDSVVETFRSFARLQEEIQGLARRSPTSFGATVWEPYGVAGLITPWNFPLSIAAVKVAPALAAGNTVVLKPAEQACLSVLKFADLVEDVFPPGTFNVVTGTGTDAGEPLTKHPEIGKLSFTGSSAVGRQVMANAAKHITDVTLELGGKNPLIVFSDVDVEETAETVAHAIFFNGGECCTAGSRVFVHEDVQDAFVTELSRIADGLTIGDPLLPDTDIGAKVSADQVARVESYLTLTERTGGTVHVGGMPLDETLVESGCFVRPQLVTNLEHNSRAVQEEVFGPVQQIFAWSSFEDVITLANDVNYGLAAGVFTNDLGNVQRAVRDLEAGYVWVNQYHTNAVGLPTGGYKQSGIGREGGMESLREYTQIKSIDIAFDP
ncbi:aldehyde dehydrogenase (plasmid) [Haloferax gibbonsii]|uniref:Aldehyde dehydrogenase n=1 Tax=Haloferax gibbonsii TaxID=35746 RepID=A0A871BN15_HALGI|nr:aldehyde dehydrogenase family protein [Haloferax gibbonsii]QOS14100.1 aldehyde dehydrogenase [Haloferax gibbonsii]